MPEDATVDEEGVQLGGKRAAILYAHRLREAETAAVNTGADAEAAAKPDEKTGGNEDSVSAVHVGCVVHVFSSLKNI